MRIFKTKDFARLARKQSKSDDDLRESANRAERGLIDADPGRRRRQAQAHRPSAGRSTQPLEKGDTARGIAREQRARCDHHAAGTHHTSLIPGP